VAGVVNPGDAGNRGCPVASADVSPIGPASPDVVIIGAGQAGLAVGYHLARRGVPFVIVDAADRIGDQWRQRWDSLRLFTPAAYNSLPGLRFPAPARSFPDKDAVARFLADYARRFELPVRTGLRVERLWREADRYVMACGDDRLEAAGVVVATGAYRTPWTPAFAGELDPAIGQLHSSAYRNPSQLRDGPVLVVGAGNSGAELALEVAGHGHQTWLSGRDVGQEAPYRPGSLPDRLITPVAWFLLSRVLTASTPPGRAMRRRFQSRGTPRVRVTPKDLTGAGVELVPRTTGVQHGLPVLADGRTLTVSNVLWSTGFGPGLGWIDLPVLDQRGFPVHHRGVVADQPGLYFVGQFFLHSLTSPLIGGVGRDARYLAEHLTHRRSVAGSLGTRYAPGRAQRVPKPGAGG
jgi:putative flavoprotein involved in K+ transport